MPTAYSVHSDTPWLGPAGRLDQAKAIAAHAAAFDWPVVIGGDFNTSDPGSVESIVDAFTSRSFTWASREVPASVGGPFGDKKLDHFFVKGFGATAAGTVPTDASDHQPIWVELARVPE